VINVSELYAVILCNTKISFSQSYLIVCLRGRLITVLQEMQTRSSDEDSIQFNSIQFIFQIASVKA